MHSDYDWTPAFVIAGVLGFLLGVVLLGLVLLWLLG